MGAPAFMRGKERFSAPRNSLDSIMRFSAGNARAVLYGLYRLRKNPMFLKGTTYLAAASIRSYVNHCRHVRL